MRILIKGGTIVTASEEFQGDVLVEGETIRAVGQQLDLPADQVIDAAGKYVLPGGVDQHTHFSALCNVGDQDTAGYETTDAVVTGGTTTIVDYAPQDPKTGLLDSIDYRINVRAKDKACVDFALHGMVTEIMDSIFDEIAQFPQKGISSIKIFMAYNGSPLHVDDGTFFRILECSRRAGVTVFVHAENGEILDFLRRRCVKNGQTTPHYHYVSRPPFTEAEAVRRAIYLAGQTDTPLYIAHMTCRPALEALLQANLPAGSYGNGCKYCIVVAQAIPAATTINAPVVITIGTGTEQYPMTNRCCAQVTACGIRTRTRYSTVVSTSATGGTFKLLGNICPCPTNNLRSINGTSPAAPAAPTT